MSKRWLLVALLATGIAGAQTEKGYITDRKIEPGMFNQLVRTLEQEMGPGGRFEFVSDAERSAVTHELSVMGGLLQGHETLATLREDDKISLINAQERANAILTQRDGERLICERRKLVGSNMRQSVCETYAERQARVRGSRDRANKLNRRVQQCNESGICVSG
jgi:hypothetical protein